MNPIGTAFGRYVPVDESKCLLRMNWMSVVGGLPSELALIGLSRATAGPRVRGRRLMSAWGAEGAVGGGVGGIVAAGGAVEQRRRPAVVGEVGEVLDVERHRREGIEPQLGAG